MKQSRRPAQPPTPRPAPTGGGRGKTLALAGVGIIVVVAVVGSFALFKEDDPGRAKGHAATGAGTGTNGKTDPRNDTKLPAATGQTPSNTGGVTATPTKPLANGNRGTGTPRNPGVGSGAGTPVPTVQVRPRVVEGKGGGPVIVVHGPDNQPVVGAVVEASTRKGSLAPRPTNKDGEANLDFVPAADGRITGSVRHPRFDKPATFSCEPSPARVDVRFTATATGYLVGSIHDARGQAPAAPELSVIDPNGGETVLPSASFASYDSSGRFKVELAPGIYTVKASAPGFVASEMAVPTITAGQEGGNVDLLLEAGGTVLGKVVLPPDLQSQRDPIVLAFDLEWVRGDMQNPVTTIDHRQIQIANDGSFQLDNLQSGMYRIRAGDGQRLTNWSAAKVDAGSRASATALTFDSGPPVAPVRGIVRDSRGGVVAGAMVKTRIASVVTDASGAFELRGLDGGQNHDITIEKAGYVTYAGKVEVPVAGQTLPDMAFTLDPRSSATGKITRKGQPASGIKVVIAQKIEGGGIVTYGPATTDGSGAWRIDDLENGNYYMKAGEAANNAFDERGGTPFSVRPGETATVPAVDVP